MVEIDCHLCNWQPNEHPAMEILTIMKKNGEKEEGMRDAQEEVGGKRMVMMTRRMNLPPQRREDFPEHWEKPSGKLPKSRQNPLRNTNRPNTRILRFGLLPVRISSIPTHTNGKKRWTESNTLGPSKK